MCSVNVDGQLISNVENDNALEFHSVKLYVTNNHADVANVYLRDFQWSNEN